MELVASRFLRSLICAVACLVTLPAYAQVGIGGFGRAVGGVMIDAGGAVRSATIEERQELAQLFRNSIGKPAGDLAQAVPLRLISLRGLQQTVADSIARGQRAPLEAEFLAGLTRVEYVFVDVDNQDIVIGGPAEPWLLQNDGSVVGQESGMPTLRLEDLLVAMRSVETARNGGISVSIEPTTEGRLRLQQLLKNIRVQPGQNPAMLEPAMREAFGPQQVLLNGVPADSRYARTLVAADYEMKRIAMQLVESPLTSLPSYLQIARNANHSRSENPRWWMACNYDAMTRSEDGMAWKLSGQGVKTLTEQDFTNEDGTVAGSGASSKLAQKWADLMTENFNELCRKMPIFGDLRNTIDLTVVATLIVQERLAEKAGVDLSVLQGVDSNVTLANYPAPKTLDPQCSFIRGRAGWTVTASGGVDVNAFTVVQNQVTDNAIGQTQATALKRDDVTRWWWNG